LGIRLHIFFQFGCGSTPVKYYGSRFGYPLTSTTTGKTGETGATGATGATGILGVLGILGGIGWAFGFDLFQRTFQHNEPKPKTPANERLGFGL
jgi:hypothetical protein